MLSLLGWRYSVKAAKRQPMQTAFAALGVVFDFADTVSASGRIKVQNKESRVEQVCGDIDRVTFPWLMLAPF